MVPLVAEPLWQNLPMLWPEAAADGAPDLDTVAEWLVWFGHDAQRWWGGIEVHGAAPDSVGLAGMAHADASVMDSAPELRGAVCCPVYSSSSISLGRQDLSKNDGSGL